MTYLNKIQTVPADSVALDAFGRQRVSNPEGIFDAQFTYDAQPLLYEQIATGTGATIAHNAAEGCLDFTFASSPSGSYSYVQSFEHFRYQPGKSQEISVTFNMVTGTVGVQKYAGYAMNGNGIDFLLDGGDKFVRIKSTTTNGDQVVAQDDWNLDKLDGTGKSGITLDINKTQIFVIDFQALYVGRVRVGFNIDGVVYYCHEFLHGNKKNTPYIRTANLPVRMGMNASSTASTTMSFYCASVVSEGGQDDVAGYGFSAEGIKTAESGADTHILSIRPKKTFNGQVNRAKFVLETVDLIVTGSSPVKWKLVLGQNLSGTTTFDDANTTYSSFSYNFTGTSSGNPLIVIDSGYVGASNQFKGSVSKKVLARYPITLDSNGDWRRLGTISLLVHGIGGASAVRAVMNWREIR